MTEPIVADSAAVLAAGLAVEKAGRGYDELTGQLDELPAACVAARRTVVTGTPTT